MFHYKIVGDHGHRFRLVEQPVEQDLCPTEATDVDATDANDGEYFYLRLINNLMYFRNHIYTVCADKIYCIIINCIMKIYQFQTVMF